MGTVQSTHTTAREITSSEAKRSVSGRKNEDPVLVEPTQISKTIVNDLSSEEKLEDSEQEFEDSDDDSDDEDEEDEEWNERLQILKDARNLSKLADFFLNPHKPVTADTCACGRNYFSRPSAEEYEDEDESDEREVIIQEMKQLKQLAVDYMHPEKPVVSTADPCAFGRNYFSSHADEDSLCSKEEEDERARVLADAKLLKQYAEQHLHPERTVVTTDPFACGRNYFSRLSALQFEDEESAEERELVLQDMLQLKQLAVDFLHPEKPVVTTDAFASGRNYFSRPSADVFEDEDAMDDRDEIMEDMKHLKQLSMDFLQPERAVEVDELVSSRCYFDRFSAPKQGSEDEAEERAQILADAQALKKLAVDYLHPEKPVVTSDPYACGRNYFSRPSAVEDIVDMEEKEMIMQEMQQLKQLAVDYLHPENPVTTSSGYACGRNYFTRPSAEAYEESNEEKDLILEEAAQLKHLAVNYLHPEKPVSVEPTATGRNYFSRFTASEYEDEDTADELEEIMEDMQLLKSLAQDFLQPERPVQVSPMAFCQNYFDRSSGVDLSKEDVNEKELILAEMKQLKQLAVDYMNPEKPLRTTDPFACGRNYFSRPSALHYEDEESAEERDLVLQDMLQLKQLAVDYLNPEKPVVATDAFACGRNYFSRPSADGFEDEDTMDDRDEIMEDMKHLKQLSMDYLQPERAVEVDELVSSRCYFDRFSAPKQGSEDEAEERAQILADAQALKKLAVDYLHPEKPVVTSDPYACGRNYFSRPSAMEDIVDMEEKEMIMQEMQQLKQLAVDYLHPENPVTTSSGYACGRNYFSRPSSEAYEESNEEKDLILEEAAQLKQLAVNYLHPEKPVSVEPTATGRNYYSRGSAPEQQSFEDSKEEARIHQDMLMLKQTSKDYMHPESPIGSSWGARSFFDRASASGHADHIHSEGHANDEKLNDHYAYHDHVLGLVHQEHDDHSHQSEHFDMDEDALQTFRDNLHSTELFKGHHPKEVASDEEGGDLSRSPSSVMLFDLGSM